MSGLVFAGLVLLVGLGLHGRLRRRADAHPRRLRIFAPCLVLRLARFDQAYEKVIGVGTIEGQKVEHKRIQAQRQAEIIAGSATGRGDEAAYDGRGTVSLTPRLIRAQSFSKWDGRLPQYTFGGHALPLVQLPGGGGRAGDGARR
jgi:hypothetical protein